MPEDASGSRKPGMPVAEAWGGALAEAPALYAQDVWYTVYQAR